MAYLDDNEVSSLLFPEPKPMTSLQNFLQFHRSQRVQFYRERDKHSHLALSIHNPENESRYLSVFLIPLISKLT